MYSTIITDASKRVLTTQEESRVVLVMDKIFFSVSAFKPVATVLMEQETVNIDGIDTTLKARGRHDPCVLPRAVPIVEAMAAMTILDYYLLDRMTQI